MIGEFRHLHDDFQNNSVDSHYEWYPAGLAISREKGQYEISQYCSIGEFVSANSMILWKISSNARKYYLIMRFFLYSREFDDIVRHLMRFSSWHNLWAIKSTFRHVHQRIEEGLSLISLMTTAFLFWTVTIGLSYGHANCQFLF